MGQIRHKIEKLKALFKSALELLFAIVYNMYWYACYFAGCFCGVM